MSLTWLWVSLAVILTALLTVLPLYFTGILRKSKPKTTKKLPIQPKPRSLPPDDTVTFSPHLQIHAKKADFQEHQTSTIMQYANAANERMTIQGVLNDANHYNVIYINMAKDTDRNLQMLEMLKQFEDDFNMYRFEGIPVPGNGAKGCYLSHLHVLAWASHFLPNQHVMILEDDFLLNSDYGNMINKLELTDRELLGRWDVIQLGQFTTEWQPIETKSNQLFRLYHATTTSGYYVNQIYVKTLFTKWLQGMDLLQNKPLFSAKDNLDQIQTLFQEHDVWIGYRTPLGQQRYGMSTIGNDLVENRWTCSDDFKHYYTADKTKKYDLLTRSPLTLKPVGVCFVATGKYKQFLKPTIDSCIMNFAKPHPLTFFIFTDDSTLFSDKSYQGFPVLVFPVERKGFPGDTLYRYHYMLKAEEELRSRTEFMFYMDVDYWVCNRDDTQNMISNVEGLIAVQHLHNLHHKQGNLKGTPETNPKSTACIHPNETMKHYFCGGFQGGSTKDYLRACKTISENINIDDERGVMAVWHDESHWNRYLVDHPPRLTLSQSYVYPEECLASEDGENSKMLRQNRITPIMIALSKNHKEFQVAAV